MLYKCDQLYLVRAYHLAYSVTTLHIFIKKRADLSNNFRLKDWSLSLPSDAFPELLNSQSIYNLLYLSYLTIHLIIIAVTPLHIIIWSLSSS